MKYEETHATALSLVLFNVARVCEGLSGRTLRKLPFLAHVFFVQLATVDPAAYAQALLRAAVKENRERATLGQRSSTAP